MEETSDEWLDRILGRDVPADLDPELEAAKEHIDGKWKLQHPLCWFDDYEERYHSFYNERFDDNRRKLEGHRKRRRWRDYLRVYDKRYWPAALLELKSSVPARRWGVLVREFWIDADEFWEDQESWRKVAIEAKGRTGLMTREEKKQLTKMPDVVTVYRGAQERNAEGLSWTTSLEWGKIFAYRSLGQVRMGTANKSDVIAFFDKHGEEKEIIVLPEHVRGRTLVSDSGSHKG